MQNQEQNLFYSKVILSIDQLAKTMHSLLDVAKIQDNALKAINEKAGNAQISLASLARNSMTQEQVNNIIGKVGNLDTNIAETLETVSGMATVGQEVSDEVKKFSEILRGEVDEIEMKMAETNQLLTAKFDEFSELLKKSNTEALVEVMKKVTEEFQKQMNLLISKLIQENFEQLNTSVERLSAPHKSPAAIPLPILFRFIKNTPSFFCFL